MIRTARSRIADVLRAAAPFFVVALAATTLLRFPPEQYGFYPQCPFHQYFQLQCPGCGATRALAALLRGHLADAMHFNAFVTLLLPLAAAHCIVSHRRFLQHKAIRWPQPPPAAVYVALGMAVVFTVIRNLPAHSF